MAFLKKPSFLSRLTGSSDQADYFDDSAHPAVFEGEGDERRAHISTRLSGQGEGPWAGGEEPQGELAVDIYQTPDAIVVKALVAGVHPSAVDIALTREMLTVSGTRE